MKRLFFLVAALAIAATATGCGELTGIDRTESALRDAGFTGVTVTVSSAHGFDTVMAKVSVDAPPGALASVVDRVSGIVWRTIDLRFDEVIVVARVPARHVKTIQPLRRDALDRLFGPRPARLDRKSIGQQLAHTGRTLLVELTIAGAAGLVAFAIVIVLLVRAIGSGTRAAQSPVADQSPAAEHSAQPHQARSRSQE